MLVLIGGRSYQLVAENRDRDRFPPPGQMIDVDGTAMHMHCTGEGSPTVVFEQGLGSLNEPWQDIFDATLATTRICYYDRLGMGYSEPLNRLVYAPEVAQRLNKLLMANGEVGDIILVGWSAGGVYIREYYRQFPDHVNGLLLVDSSHEQKGYRLPQPESSSAGIDLMRVASYLQPFGILRLSGLVEERARPPNVSRELGDRLVAHRNTSYAIRTSYQNSESFRADINQPEPPEGLGNLPLVVLSQGIPVEELVPDGTASELEFRRESRHVWNKLQAELAGLSSNSRHIVATESGHAIHAGQPELLIQAIRDLVATARFSVP
ncbi:MAG: alpha/beta hydrolase [Gammaproteobacteria bacterium]